MAVQTAKVTDERRTSRDRRNHCRVSHRPIVFTSSKVLPGGRPNRPFRISGKRISLWRSKKRNATAYEFWKRQKFFFATRVDLVGRNAEPIDFSGIRVIYDRYFLTLCVFVRRSKNPRARRVDYRYVRRVDTKGFVHLAKIFLVSKIDFFSC